MVLNPMTDVFKRRGEDTADRIEGHVKMAAEIGVMLPQAMDAKGHKKLGGANKDYSLPVSKRAWS